MVDALLQAWCSRSKRRFDPDNLFRMNLNIKPAAQARQSSAVRA
jgi:hypothetical protein